MASPDDDAPIDRGTSKPMVGLSGLPFRLILAGRTGLEDRIDGELARDAIRVSTPLEAIGEVARLSGARATPLVVVASSELDNGRPDKGAAAEFVAAVRRVHPRARVVRAVDGSVGGDPAPFDHCLSVRDASQRWPEVLAELAGQDRAGQMDRAAPAPAEPPRPSDIDTTLVSQIVTGRSVGPTAIAMLRSWLGRDDLRFVPAPSSEHSAATSPAHACVVRWRDRELGWLAGDRALPGGIEPYVAWLGAWLMLDNQHQQLREAAFTDPLTGARNRRYFERFLSAAIETARRERRHITILFFDIDDFKQYNDRYGHAAGDEILIQMVRLLQSVIRPTDRVCRIGGDEFVVVFHEPEGPRTPTSRPPQSVSEMARRFQEQVCRERFPKLGAEAPGTLTISGGMATFPWDGGSPGELLRCADQLAMQSKQQGKNLITLGPGAQRVCQQL